MSPAPLRLYRVGEAGPGEPALPEAEVWARDREGACRLWREARWAASGPRLVGDERLRVLAQLPPRGEGAPDWEEVRHRPRGAAPPVQKRYHVRSPGGLLSSSVAAADRAGACAAFRQAWPARGDIPDWELEVEELWEEGGPGGGGEPELRLYKVWPASPAWAGPHAEFWAASRAGAVEAWRVSYRGSPNSATLDAVRGPDTAFEVYRAKGPAGGRPLRWERAPIPDPRWAPPSARSYCRVPCEDGGHFSFEIGRELAGRILEAVELGAPGRAPGRAPLQAVAYGRLEVRRPLAPERPNPEPPGSVMAGAQGFKVFAHGTSTAWLDAGDLARSLGLEPKTKT